MCDLTFLGMCVSAVPNDEGQKIFGFSEFLAAFALLVLVFNQSDPVYKFRIMIAPFNLYITTFVLAGLIGFGSLLTDVWFAERWYSLEWGVTHTQIQAVFAAAFLLLFFTWLWFGFIKPAAFSRWNFKNYFNSLYWTTIRGKEDQLPVIASEIGHSAKALIRHAIDWQPRYDGREIKHTEIQSKASDTLLLMGNSKLCRFVVSHAPITAIAFMEEASEQKKYHVALSQFAKNVTLEAIRNTDSILHHEDNGYRSGLSGYSKPFTRAMFGDYRLIEGLASNGGSPFDLEWSARGELTPPQLESFKRALLTTYENYLDVGAYHTHSRSMREALEVIKGTGSKLYTLNNLESIPFPCNELACFGVGVDFIKEAIDLIDARPDVTFSNSWRDKNGFITNPNALDDLAEAMFELFFDTSGVKSSASSAHSVQHNAFWGSFFSFRKNTKSWDLLRRKFFRLIFDEIKRMEDFPNFKGAALLGTCLNVLGLTLPLNKASSRTDYSLHKVVIDWTQRNYLALIEANPRVANACLIGGISFDEKESRLVKTYLQGLNTKPNQVFLPLKPPAKERTAAKGKAKRPALTITVASSSKQRAASRPVKGD